MGTELRSARWWWVGGHGVDAAAHPHGPATAGLVPQCVGQGLGAVVVIDHVPVVVEQPVDRGEIQSTVVVVEDGDDGRPECSARDRTSVDVGCW